MKIESYIKKIIQETGLSKQEIQEMVTNKKEELKGLISDEGALFVIAKELGVDVKEENKELIKEIDINISDLTINMKNIVIAGRIKEIYPIRNFNREGGETGHVGSFLLNDKSGDIRIVLWDDHVNIFNDTDFDINELVKIVNGTPRKGKFGGMEIHLGKFSKITINPEDVDYKLYPKIEFKKTNIGDINLNLSSVSVEGQIIQSFPIKEFSRKDGGEGKVGSLILADSTGSIRITFWNEETEELKKLESGDTISITNLTPRLSTLDSKTIDLHVNKGATINKKEKKVQIQGELVENIKSLQEQTGIVSFKGLISSVDNLKKVNLKNGEEVSLLGFTVSDETDGIRITLWKEKVDEYIDKISVGKGLLLENVMVKYSNFSSRNEISLINDSKIKIIDLEINNIKEIESPKKERFSNFTGSYTKIDSIKEAGTFEIKGFIAKELNNITIYEACPNCNKKVDNCNCDEKGEPENRMIFNLIIDDGSGTIRTTFIGENAEKLIGEPTNIIYQIKETPDFESFLAKKSSEFLGRDILIKGRAKYSDYSSSYEIFAYDYKDMDIDEELNRIMKGIES